VTKSLKKGGGGLSRNRKAIEWKSDRVNGGLYLSCSTRGGAKGGYGRRSGPNAINEAGGREKTYRREGEKYLWSQRDLWSEETPKGSKTQFEHEKAGVKNVT